MTAIGGEPAEPAGPAKGADAAQAAAGAPDDWAPVVYGRTDRADFWWRAVPEGMTHRGWLETAVQAVVGGGRQLDEPRFLLARSGDGRLLTGVAAQAAEFSADMNSHAHRPLYCFVGWLAATAPAAPPTLGELRAHWRDWAGPVYREWVGPVWEEDESRLREPRRSRRASAPWAAVGGAGEPVAPAAGDPGRRPPGPLDIQPGAVWLIPGSEAGQHWASGLATRQPYVLVTGWPSARKARRDGATHVCADDAALSLEALPVRRPPEPAEPHLADGTAGLPPDADQRPPASQPPDPGHSPYPGQQPYPSPPGYPGQPPPRPRQQPPGPRDRRQHGPLHKGFDAVKATYSALGHVAGLAREAYKYVTDDEADYRGPATPPASDAAEKNYRMSQYGWSPVERADAPEPAAYPPPREPGRPAGTSPASPPEPKPGPVPGRTAEVDPGDANYDDFFE